MKEILIHNVKIGQQLAQPVITSLGGTLYHAGHEITDQDYEILKAFLIEKVYVQSTDEIGNQIKEEEPVHKPKEAEHERIPSIEKEYYHVVGQTEKIFLDTEGGITPPILEIRSFLIPFVKNALSHPHLVLEILKYSNNCSYMAHHAVSLSVLTSFLALKSGVDEKEIPQVCLAGFLHNIGQLKIHETILNKKEALTQEEFEEIKRHPVFGYEMLKKAPGISDGVKLAALQHHEREDGSGYPNRLKSSDIHPYAKMIAITDVYYAMCSERSYKQAKSPFLVVEQLKSDSYGKLDPKYVYFFVDLVTSYLSIGSRVMLSNGQIGEIVYTDKNTPTKPMINCGGDIINLQKNKDIYIEFIEL